MFIIIIPVLFIYKPPFYPLFIPNVGKYVCDTDLSLYFIKSITYSLNLCQFFIDINKKVIRITYHNHLINMAGFTYFDTSVPLGKIPYPFPILAIFPYPSLLNILQCIWSDIYPLIFFHTNPVLILVNF